MSDHNIAPSNDDCQDIPDWMEHQPWEDYTQEDWEEYQRRKKEEEKKRKERARKNLETMARLNMLQDLIIATRRKHGK